MDVKNLIDVAVGRHPADLVLRNGKIVNVLSDEIYEADVAIVGDRIAAIGSHEGKEVVDLQGRYICPGFIDAHVHIESSLLSVPEFAKVASVHGTVAVITDPHEIANVMGAEGIRYMLTSSKYCPVWVYVMLSSCVPASTLETAGAELLAEDLLPLLNDKWVLGLGEMMNYPGVVAGHVDVLEKLKMSSLRVIDGHSPGLSGRDLQAYVASGVQSDHECTTLEEAQEKLRLGMHIMVREGSNARNLETLLPLIKPSTAERFMFVTDDKDVLDLMEEGQIDFMIRKAIAGGLQPATAVRLATINSARYFGLKGCGAVAPGYFASLVILDDLKECRVGRVYHAGRLVAQDGASLSEAGPSPKRHVLRSTVNVHWLEPDQFIVRARNGGQQNVHVIEMSDGQLETDRSVETLEVVDGQVVPDVQRDIAKIVVVERHQASGRMGIGFIRGLGLNGGALASTIAHDAHNIVVAGTNDRDIYAAAVHLVKMRGGLCAVKNGQVLADMPLPIAGLMSDAPAAEAGAQLQQLHETVAREMGCPLRKPFMGLSFMSLSVIGSLKLSDQGLIDVELFKPIDLLL